MPRAAGRLRGPILVPQDGDTGRTRWLDVSTADTLTERCYFPTLKPVHSVPIDKLRVTRFLVRSPRVRKCCRPSSRHRATWTGESKWTAQEGRHPHHIWDSQALGPICPAQKSLPPKPASRRMRGCLFPFGATKQNDC